MIKALSYILVFIIGLSGISCKKIIPDDIHGEVKDETTDGQVAGATVFLVRKKSEFMSTAGYSVVETTTTNDAGEFIFHDVDYEKGYMYGLYAIDENYIDENTYPAEIEGRGKRKKTSLFLKPKGFIRIRVINSNPYNQNDQIWVGWDTSNGEIFTISGDTVDIYVIDPLTSSSQENEIEVYGNRYSKVYYTVKKNNVQTQHEVSIYCPAFTVTDYTIHY